MFISTSFVRKVVATLGAVVGFVFVYETTIRDSRYSLRPASVAEATAQPTVGMSLNFTATAYCKGETTTSGVVDAPYARYDGIYTIMDTGPAVQGRALDLYTWSCNEALKFGRRPVRVNVLRLGWNPQNSEPAAVDAMFQRREREKADTPLPAKVEPEPAVAPTGSTTQPPQP